MIAIQMLAYLCAVNCGLAAAWVYFSSKATEKVDNEWSEPMDDKHLDYKMKLIYRKMYFIDKE